MQLVEAGIQSGVQLFYRLPPETREHICNSAAIIVAQILCGNVLTKPIVKSKNKIMSSGTKITGSVFIKVVEDFNKTSKYQFSPYFFDKLAKLDIHSDPKKLIKITQDHIKVVHSTIPIMPCVTLKSLPNQPLPRTNIFNFHQKPSTASVSMPTFNFNISKTVSNLSAPLPADTGLKVFHIPTLAGSFANAHSSNLRGLAVVDDHKNFNYTQNILKEHITRHRQLQEKEFEEVQKVPSIQNTAQFAEIFNANHSRADYGNNHLKVAESLKFQLDPSLNKLLENNQVQVKNHFELASKLGSHPLVIKSQLTLGMLSSPHSGLNENVQSTVLKMQKVLFFPDGSYKGILPHEQKRLLDSVAAYNEERATEWNIFSAAKQSWDERGIDYSDFNSKIVSHPYNNDLYNFIDAWEKKDINRADHFLKLIKPNHAFDNCSSCVTHRTMNNSFHDLHSTIYNEHNIKHIYTQDPLWENCKKLLNKNDPAYLANQQALEFNLELRHRMVQPLLRKLSNNEDLPKTVKDICYGLTYKIADSEAIADHLSVLSSDDPDANIREAFKIIYDKRLISKFCNFPHLENYKDIQMPEELGKQKNILLRNLAEKLYALEPSTPRELSLVRDALVYIKEASIGSPQSEEYKAIAKSLYSSMTVEETDRSLWQCGNLAQVYNDPKKQEIQNSLLSFVKDLTAALYENPAESITPITREVARVAFAEIEQARQYLASGNSYWAVQHIEEYVIPSLQGRGPAFGDRDNTYPVIATVGVASIVALRNYLPGAPSTSTCSALPQELDHAISNTLVLNSSDKQKIKTPARQIFDAEICTSGSGGNFDPDDPEEKKTSQKNNLAELVLVKEKNTKIGLEEALNKWQKSTELHELEKIIEKLKIKVPDKRVGRLETSGMPSTKYEKILREIDAEWDKLRNISTDIEKISQNTGIDKKIIEKIKNHLFHEEHILDSGIKRFEPLPEVYYSWKRLNDGSFVQSDLKLLIHEFAESILMKAREVEYDSAHIQTNVFFNWESQL